MGNRFVDWMNKALSYPCEYASFVSLKYTVALTFDRREGTPTSEKEIVGLGVKTCSDLPVSKNFVRNTFGSL